MAEQRLNIFLNKRNFKSNSYYASTYSNNLSHSMQ
jgi:hypothetical protein